MDGKHYIYLKRHLPLIALIITSILCIAISLSSLKSGWFIIFQNSFYIPIIISCFYYKKRGFIFSVILSCIYFLLVLAFTKESSIIFQAIIRVFIFIFIAGVVTYLSLIYKQVKELRVLNVYNRSLIEASLDPLLVIGMDGKIIDVNNATETATGYSRTELIGTEFSGYFIETEQVRTIYQDVFRVGYFRNEPLKIRHRDGHVTLVLYNASLYQDEKGQAVGVFAAARDITDRKEAEDSLRKSEENFRHSLDDSPLGVRIVTAEGETIYANKAILDIYGYDSIEELKNTPLHKRYTPETYAEFQLRKEKRLCGESDQSEYEISILRKNGEVRYIHVLRKETFWNSKKQFQVIYQDITERKQAEERTRKALGATVQAIAVTVETRDPYTAGHQRKVADLARAIATEMNLPIDMIDEISISATIHDLGKISIPSEILSKPTKLTDIEFSLIKTHPHSGYDILKNIDFPWPIARIVLEHHERMNGSGYPNGLTGDNILLESKILAVADVVEAMASHRPYRPSLGIDVALEEIEKNKGILYDNAVADACLRLFRGKDYQLQG
jgi:PAS domain S-box-containing protein